MRWRRRLLRRQRRHLRICDRCRWAAIERQIESFRKTIDWRDVVGE